ncbi:MAG: transposase [Syntrophales bacterium]|nr:transposase [Syntrophales bacterium]
MPRKSRIDAPGALHHITVRGIERKAVFQDDRDRDDFLERIGTNLEESRTPCYAWALLPNHFHLLLRTGATPISMVLRRVLTGYAIGYNMRHRRHGHLFQSRFKSILCQEDVYLLELVRYIHLNPLRARMVDDLESLDRYPYCGHSRLMGKCKSRWQDTDYILKLFDATSSTARRRYAEFVVEGIPQGRRPDLIGGGLIRSVGGWSAVKALRKAGAYRKGDERILGDWGFMENVLAQAKEDLERKYHLRARGFDFEKVVNRVAELTGIESSEVLSAGKYKKVTAARSLVCFWAVRELGISQTRLARMLRISQPAVSVAVSRGEKLAKDRNFCIDE